MSALTVQSGGIRGLTWLGLDPSLCSLTTIYLTPELLDRLYQKTQHCPEAWLTTATNLRKAADILFAECPEGWGPDGEPIKLEKLYVLAPASMLYGFALENAIKGYLIMKHGGLDAAQKAHRGAWTGHRLQALAVATSLPLNDHQKLLLLSVDALVRWAGRYPLSLNRKEFTLPKQLNASDGTPPILLDKMERCILDPFYEKLIGGLHADLIARLSTPPPDLGNTAPQTG